METKMPDLKFRLVQILNMEESELKIIDNERKNIHNGRWRDMSLSIEGTEIAIIIVDIEQFLIN